MTWATASIRHGEQIKLKDAADLEALRSRLSCRTDTRPIIVTLESPACCVDLGQAGDLGFVQGRSPDGDPPYRVSVGDASAGGVVSFFLHGGHHTEIPARHLVSIGDAWAAASTLLDTGIYMPSITWDEA